MSKKKFIDIFLVFTRCSAMLCKLNFTELNSKMLLKEQMYCLTDLHYVLGNRKWIVEHLTALNRFYRKCFST